MEESNKQAESKPCTIHGVSVRDFNVGDAVCTKDGRIWVINEVDGDDLLVDGNGRRNFPLEKSDVYHAR